jgi:hypothetical protein
VDPDLRVAVQSTVLTLVFPVAGVTFWVPNRETRDTSSVVGNSERNILWVTSSGTPFSVGDRVFVRRRAGAGGCLLLAPAHDTVLDARWDSARVLSMEEPARCLVC